MKTIFNQLIVGLTSTALLTLATFTSATEFTLPAYEKLTLKNGLTVYLMKQDEVPLVDVVAIVKAGAINDDKAGLAQMTASNLLLGTQSLTRQDLQEKLDFIGAETNSSAALEYSVLSASLASKDIDTVMPLFRDILLTPAFDKAEFEQDKARYLAGLERQKESPRAKIGQFFNALLYADHPYANSLSGNVDSVQSITLDDVKAFHKTWFSPHNSAVIVTGDIETKEMAKRLKSLFGEWQGEKITAKPSKALSAPSQANVLLVNKSDATESTFVIGGPGIKRSNKDYVAVSVINTILGGRFTSWLNDELRVNTGLTYGAGSRFSSNKEGGSFLISTFTKTSTTTEAIDLALKTYSKLWEKGLDEKTLESAKSYVKGQFPPKYETSSDIAFLLAEMFVYDFDESFINRFTQQVNMLTLERSKEVIAKYFPKENMQFVIVGKADEIRDSVKQYGKLIEADIKDNKINLQ
ncbi:M16 family metallopeptidase [Glaciecola sp. MF2-115]|uniref:M16 family metallopeptidase n=1 Tax=Glaciecola sp. MF2-115 TaxID=3384827 RepID=UPI0039A21C27